VPPSKRVPSVRADFDIHHGTRFLIAILTQKKQWNTPDLETDDFASLCLDISWFPGGWARHRDHTALEATETGPWLCVVHSLQSCQAHLCLIWPVCIDGFPSVRLLSSLQFHHILVSPNSSICNPCLLLTLQEYTTLYTSSQDYRIVSCYIQFNNLIYK